MNQDALCLRASEIALGFGGGIAVAGAFVAGMAVGARLGVEAEDVALSFLAGWMAEQYTDNEAADYDAVIADLIAAARS